jgi:hypothetical protein
MRYSWVAMFGQFDIMVDKIIFRGRPSPSDPTIAGAGYIICDQTFSGGTIRASVEFSVVDEKSTFEMILWYDPATENMLTAGMGAGGYMSSIRLYNKSSLEQKWTTFASSGDARNLQPGKTYDLAVSLRGSRITLVINGVHSATFDLKFSLRPTQVGAFFLGNSDTILHDYSVETQRPRAFAVMEFGPGYDDLYSEVIKPACDALKLDVIRADERLGPGLIIADIVRDIVEAKVVIAEVTPANRNVYFEVGYAYAVNKPTILLAKEGTSLPFDLRSFRHLFYEDSIRGKARVEEALRKHLQTVLSTGEGVV